MRRAFVIILDGLRRDFVSPERTPCLSEFATVAACFEAHRSVFPSATRAVSAAFATGCHPASNGLQGNTVALFKDGRLAIHDVGRPDFFECKRSITGKSLARPTLAERLSGAGGAVIFNNVSPGAIKTSINEEEWGDEEGKKKMLEQIPYGRIGDPEDIAKAVRWLVTDDADYITGVTLYVDGGMTLYPSFSS